MEKEKNSIVKFLFGLIGITILTLLFYLVGYIISPYIKIDSSDNITLFFIGIGMTFFIGICSTFIIGIVKLIGEITYNNYNQIKNNIKTRK